MPRPLPLPGLRAFAEAGRALSMQVAASKLGVTPEAVSQQVKLLEARLDIALFERGNRTIRLTPAGEQLLAGVAGAFQQIEAAFDAVERDRAPERSSLVVSTIGSFAATWLVPRLGGFVARYPGVDVRIQTTPDLVPLGTGPGTPGIAIRHGLGDWPGVEAVPLLRPRLVPVGSPALLAKGPPIRRPGDCLRYRLLHDPEAADWRLWLQAMGAADSVPRAGRGTRFADSILLLRAAAAGQGLALLRDTYAADDLAAGRLQVAFAAPWPTQFAYYVVTARRGAAPPARAFRDWLLSEAAADPGG